MAIEKRRRAGMLRVALSVGEEVCMNKENTDQVIRCIKECWWRVGFLLLLAIGLALLVMYGWPFKVHVDVKLLNWVQTVAACIAGFGGIYTAHIALSISLQDREKQRQSALRYLLVEKSTFSNFKIVIDSIFRDEPPSMGSDILEVEKSLKILQSINKERVMEASTAFGDLLLATESRISSFLQTVSYINDIPFQYGLYPNLAKDLKVNAAAMDRAVNELFYKNENWESFLDIRGYE